MADYDLLWSTMTRYHGGVGGGDGYSTQLPGRWAQEQNLSRVADRVPSRLKCPISGELMTDPVVASDGFTYEREMIAEWFRRGHATSPLTGARLKSTALTPNQNLRQLILEFRERNCSLEWRSGRVRFLRTRLDEAEARVHSLSRDRATAALRQQVDSLMQTNRTLEEQVFCLFRQLRDAERRAGRAQDDDDEEYGFPPSDIDDDGDDDDGEGGGGGGGGNGDADIGNFDGQGGAAGQGGDHDTSGALPPSVLLEDPAAGLGAVGLARPLGPIDEDGAEM